MKCTWKRLASPCTVISRIKATPNNFLYTHWGSKNDRLTLFSKNLMYNSRKEARERIQEDKRINIVKFSSTVLSIPFFHSHPPALLCTSCLPLDQVSHLLPHQSGPNHHLAFTRSIGDSEGSLRLQPLCACLLSCVRLFAIPGSVWNSPGKAYWSG